jgi:hypothetical protein
MDDVQLGKITCRRRHTQEGGHFRVAPGTRGIGFGGGRSWLIWRAWQAIQGGCGEIRHFETWRKLQHLQILLPTEWEGFVYHASVSKMC